jgi:hypothetical protein
MSPQKALIKNFIAGSAAIALMSAAYSDQMAV